MPGTTSTAIPSFSHDQHHKTDAAKRKGDMMLSDQIWHGNLFWRQVLGSCRFTQS